MQKDAGNPLSELPIRGSLLLSCWQVVGRKRAPNFTQEQRPLVYRAWQQYERAKASQMGWDRADLAAHLYRQLVTPGAYRGDFFDAIYRDEVQDFTQVGWAGCTGTGCWCPSLSCCITTTQSA
jgi:hypothetical protein